MASMGRDFISLNLLRSLEYIASSFALKISMEALNGLFSPLRKEKCFRSSR